MSSNVTIGPDRILHLHGNPWVFAANTQFDPFEGSRFVDYFKPYEVRGYEPTPK